MPNPAPAKVAVSYAWKEENGGENAKTVGGFCEQLRNAGITVIRDIDRLKHGECITSFMRSVGASEFLCVFLSDAYLKSPNCMYEMLVAWQKSRDNPNEFRSRVKVWVMPGAEIRSAENRLNYSKYWKAERDCLAPLIQDGATDGLAAAELENFRRIKQIAEHVNEMLCFFADALSPQSVDEFQKWIQDEFRDADLTAAIAAIGSCPSAEQSGRVPGSEGTLITAKNVQDNRGSSIDIQNNTFS